MSDLKSLTDNLSVDKKGVMVQASTLGALEALLQFLRVETKPPIPVSSVGIGTVFKKDITKISVMKEKPGCEEFATVLAFDVPVDKDAKAAAEEAGVKIFTADIIYHLFDHFTRYMEDLAEKRKADAAAVAVFPSIVKILPQHIFNTKVREIFSALSCCRRLSWLLLAPLPAAASLTQHTRANLQTHNLNPPPLVITICRTRSS